MFTKQCIKCIKFKPINEFEIRSDTGKLRNVCHNCRLTQIQTWQNANREKVNKNQRFYNEGFEGRTILLFNSARIRALNKKEEFKLTLEDVRKGISKGFCCRTGILFDYEMNYRKEKGFRINPRSPSIDKMNPFGIYEPDNVQYVCSWYNIAKGQSDDEYFISMCKNMIGYQNVNS